MTSYTKKIENINLVQNMQKTYTQIIPNNLHAKFHRSHLKKHHIHNKQTLITTQT